MHILTTRTKLGERAFSYAGPQARGKLFEVGGATFPPSPSLPLLSLPIPPLPFSSFLFTSLPSTSLLFLSLPFPSLPLEVGPLKSS